MGMPIVEVSLPMVGYGRKALIKQAQAGGYCRCSDSWIELDRTVLHFEMAQGIVLIEMLK